MASDTGTAGDGASPRARISLITSVLNGEPYIGEMLASIPSGLPIEHLAIDAGSTDGTVARLKADAGIELLCRPGMSLYAAWNLALEVATGDALWFVNADDTLPPGAVAAVLDALERFPDADIVQGQAKAFSENNRREPSQPSVRYPTPGDALSSLDLIFGAPVINARVFRRRIVERTGPFDTGYRFAADREWLLRMAFGAQPADCVEIDAPLYRYRIHSGSMTLSQTYRRRLETAEEHRRIAESWRHRLSSRDEDRDMINAWRARETLVGMAAALRMGKMAAAGRHALWLCAGLPASAASLAQARRYRAQYVARMDASAVETD